MTEQKQQPSWFSSLLLKALGFIEKLGNALPHSTLLFMLLAALAIIISWIATVMDFQAIHPVKKDIILPVNLLSLKGLHLLLSDAVKNYTGFAPLGTVLVTMLGFGVAEKSGLLSTLLRLIVLKAPRYLIVPSILFAGVLSHTASDIGYVLLVPLAALSFHVMGMHPLAGLACCFAGVSGGYAANVLLSTADTLLSGLSQEAARILDPTYIVTPLSNWYFMATSSVMIVGIGTLVTNKIIIPYLGEYKGTAERTILGELGPDEKRGLAMAGIVTLALVSLLLLGLVPEAGFLRDQKADIFHSPAIKGVVPIIFLFGSLTGLAYGYTTGRFKSQNDVIQAMQDTMVTLAPYLVLIFFVAQFIALFNASNLGIIFAIHGAEFLKNVGLSGVPLMISFIALICFLDLLIGSASAKWALVSPIFVPMFMLLGYSPELSQATYRIGDSVVNIISPLMPYFPLILSFANKYEPNAKIGTVMALMIPYTVSFFIFWAALVMFWMTFEWPLGPGAQLWYSMPIP